jgi:hypothetical protein
MTKLETTFGSSAAGTMVEAFGFRVSERGYIIHEGGELAKSFYLNEGIRIDELAGFLYENGETLLIKDNFVEIIEAAKRNWG